MSPGIYIKQREELVVESETKEAINSSWEQPDEGGVYNQYDWLYDKYTSSWQEELMPDPERSQGAIQTFLKMSKFSIRVLLNI